MPFLHPLIVKIQYYPFQGYNQLFYWKSLRRLWHLDQIDFVHVLVLKILAGSVVVKWMDLLNVLYLQYKYQINEFHELTVLKAYQHHHFNSMFLLIHWNGFVSIHLTCLKHLLVF